MMKLKLIIIFLRFYIYIQVLAHFTNESNIDIKSKLVSNLLKKK